MRKRVARNETAELPDPRFIEGITVAALVKDYFESANSILEYFTGAGYLTSWLEKLGYVTTVDINENAKCLQYSPKTNFEKRDAIEDVSARSDLPLVVAHGGLHHLVSDDIKVQKHRLQFEFVVSCLNSLSKQGYLILVDVPGTPVQSPPSCLSGIQYRLDLIPVLGEYEPIAHMIESITRYRDIIEVNLRRLGIELGSSIDGTMVPQQILEKFVHSYRTGGHRGVYPSLELCEEWILSANCRVLDSGYAFVPWVFRNWDEFSRFIPAFFCLDLLRGYDILMDVWRRAGWAYTRGSLVVVPWWIQYVIALKE